MNVAAQEDAQRVLQLPLSLLRLQDGTQGVLRSLKHQHGGFHSSQARMHVLGLGDVTACKTTKRTAGGDTGVQINEEPHWNSS